MLYFRPGYFRKMAVTLIPFTVERLDMHAVGHGEII